MSPSEFTIRRAAGQRIMAGFYGTKLNRDLKYLIDTLLVGGIILFSRNIEDREQVRRLCRDAQDYAKSCNQPRLFIAVDQEGGSVVRLKAPDFFEPPAAAQVRDAARAGLYAEITATELNSLGINMNMAPVMDVAVRGGKSVMSERCFSGDPWHVAETGTAVIQSLQKNDIMAVAKHFPGIGRTTVDSHLDLPDLDISLHQLEKSDLVPFYAAIRHKTAGIMLSHVRYTGLDHVWPASLSGAIARDLLRRGMGYQGVVITDDLEMGAIADHFDMQTAIGQIFAAEIDIALVCHNMEKVESAFGAFLSRLAADKSGRFGASLLRIMETKNRYVFY
ncbi:MAG: beta-N-acetylhexosaminidase [Desulfobacteraceae bacterium]|nr:beta-N-acetylhexosaminidase [Desulfobacteraceae bacterium]